MGTGVTPTEWLIMILLVVFIVIINVMLFLRFRNRPLKTHWTQKMSQVTKDIKDPFRAENQKMQELSEKVNQLTNTEKKANTTNPKIDPGVKNGS
ncbi:MAG TPA: hypothetical protein PK040_05320 [Anaerolineaceae bacterium]|nr:hypothetical protein [Anaerolineaceae bacterium]